MGKKRKSFKGIFLRRWLIVIFLTALVYMEGVTFFTNYQKNAMQQDYYLGQNRLINRMGELMWKWEKKGKQFANYAQYDLAHEAATKNVMSILYDKDTGEKIAGCEEKLFYIRIPKDGEADTLLVSDLSNIIGWEEYRRDIQKYCGYNTWVFETFLKNEDDYIVYTDGQSFIPESVQIEVSTLNIWKEDPLTDSPHVRETFTLDVSKNIPENYIKEDSSKYRLNAVIALGYSETSNYLDYQLACNDTSYKMLMSHYENVKNGKSTIKAEVKNSFFTISMLDEKELLLGDGKTYSLITVMYYDVWQIYAAVLIVIAVVLLILSTLFALLLARLSFIRLKARYDMEDYRRNLMRTMAHDLKSPLMSISGYAENLRDNVFSQKREYYADSILDNVQYMNNMIESILSLSKMEDSRIVLQKENLQVENILQDILKKKELQIQKKSLTIQIDGELDLKADVTLFTQALSNLVDNAVKFAPRESNINITIDTKEICFINVCEEDLSSMISSLCEPFLTGDISRSNRKGNGLGLSIVKNICELHGFRLQLDCIDGKFEAKVNVQEKK